MDKEAQELKRETGKEIARIDSKLESFMKRLSVIANLFVPGLGFLLLGKSYMKGLVSFAFYVGYWCLFIFYLAPNTDIKWLFALPLPAIVIISAAILSNE